MQTEILSLKDLERAASILKKGGVVAMPTETVYGLGASIFSEEGIRKIFEAKKRPLDNPLIAHVSSFSQIKKITTEIPIEFYMLAEKFFPGPLTVVLRRAACVPDVVSCGLPSIALRMPKNEVTQKLIDLLGEPIVAPSANLSGKPSATSLEDVLEDFEGEIDAVIDGGRTDCGIESTVISLLDPKKPIILRPGVITQKEIEEVLGKRVPIASLDSSLKTVMSPGMKYRHYAPKSPVILTYTLEEFQEASQGEKVLKLASETSRMEGALFLTAHTLYHLLRKADREHFEKVVVYCDERILSQEGLMNRLKKASSGV